MWGPVGHIAAIVLRRSGACSFAPQKSRTVLARQAEEPAAIITSQESLRHVDGRVGRPSASHQGTCGHVGGRVGGSIKSIKNIGHVWGKTRRLDQVKCRLTPVVFCLSAVADECVQAAETSQNRLPIGKFAGRKGYTGSASGIPSLLEYALPRGHVSSCVSSSGRPRQIAKVVRNAKPEYPSAFLLYFLATPRTPTGSRNLVTHTESSDRRSNRRKTAREIPSGLRLR